MTGKHKGSGILPYPAEVEALLKLVHYPASSGFLRQDEIGMGVCG